jgi:hypothetical protein
MRRILKRRPSPSMVVAFIALLVAMAGTGYAATALPQNSVGSKQLKKNAVVTAKIKKGAVNGSKVKNGSLTGSDIKNGSLTGSDIKLSSLGTVPSATNATNASIAANATNATHAASAAAIDRAIVRTAAGTTSGPTAAATASCDAGYRPVGGGARVADEQNAFVVDDFPELGGWTARVGTFGTPSGFTVFVICVPIGAVG